MSIYLAASPSSIDELMESQRDLGFCNLAKSYDGKYGVYELDKHLDINSQDLTYLSKDQEEKIEKLKISNPVVLGMVRDEMLVEKYISQSKFLTDYFENISYFLGQGIKSIRVKCLIDIADFEKGELCWGAVNIENGKKTVEVLSDDYFLYETDGNNVEII